MGKEWWGNDTRSWNDPFENEFQVAKLEPPALPQLCSISATGVIIVVLKRLYFETATGGQKRQ